MKAYLTTLAWMAFWVAIPTSCISIPPAAPMGDGAIQQIGVLNILRNSPAAAKPKPKSSVTVKVTDNAVEIRVPKK